MKKVRSVVSGHSESYEIVARREDCVTDFYRFFYGDTEADSKNEEEKLECDMTNGEHTDFLKCACLLFAAALATVILLLVI